jgi:hypothetical protein
MLMDSKLYTLLLGNNLSKMGKKCMDGREE